MSDIIGQPIAKRIQITHEMIVSVTEDLTDEQFTQRPSPTAPPIGWHLWHIARWADRLQASFPNSSGSGQTRNQIWIDEGLADRWGFDVNSLGLLEAGSLMDIDEAMAVAQTGRRRHLDYARQAFAGVDQFLGNLNVLQLESPRTSIVALRFIGDTAEEAPGEETTVIADLGFHLAHANRHLGMIEALRGAMLDMRGTASV